MIYVQEYNINQILELIISYVFLECDGGFFGDNCAESCGECFGKEQCHHVNGTCLKGCAYGYSGINCTYIEGLYPSS